MPEEIKAKAVDKTPKAKRSKKGTGKGRGGKRPGSGRPPLRPNKATEARQEAVKKTGSTPHEIQIIRMRYYAFMYATARTILEDPNTPKGGKVMPDGRPVTVGLVETYLELSGEAANDAAPYVHPKLAAIAIRDFDAWQRSQAERDEQERRTIDGVATEDLSRYSEAQLLEFIREEIGENTGGAT